jgi:hypothetical protein
MALLEVMRFQPPCRKTPTSRAFIGPAKQVNSLLHSMFQQFTVKSVKCAKNETDDTEYYYQWEAAKKRRRGKK